MGIWDCEIVKANGDLYAFVRMISPGIYQELSGGFTKIKAAIIAKLMDITDISIIRLRLSKSMSLRSRSQWSFIDSMVNMHGQYRREQHDDKCVI